MRCRPSCRNKLTRTHSQPRPFCPAPTPPRPQPHPTPCPSPIARIPSRGIKGNPIHSIPLRAIFCSLRAQNNPTPSPSPVSIHVAHLLPLPHLPSSRESNPSSTKIHLPPLIPPPPASCALPRPSRIALSSLPTTMCA